MIFQVLQAEVMLVLILKYSSLNPIKNKQYKSMLLAIIIYINLIKIDIMMTFTDSLRYP